MNQPYNHLKYDILIKNVFTKNKNIASEARIDKCSDFSASSLEFL